MAEKKSKFDRCVEDVKKGGGAKNPYAVCNANPKTKRKKGEN